MLYCARRCPQWRGWLWCFCESDTRCAVLQYRILLDRKSKWANESLRGYPRFRSGTCDNIVSGGQEVARFDFAECFRLIDCTGIAGM